MKRHLTKFDKLVVFNTRTYHFENFNPQFFTNPITGEKKLIYFYSDNKPVKRGSKDYKINERIVGEATYKL